MQLLVTTGDQTGEIGLREVAYGERGLGSPYIGQGGRGQSESSGGVRRNRPTRSAGYQRDTGWDTGFGEIMVCAEVYRVNVICAAPVPGRGRCCRQIRNVGDDPDMYAPWKPPGRLTSYQRTLGCDRRWSLG
jgi:hypothetical protein